MKPNKKLIISSLVIGSIVISGFLFSTNRESQPEVVVQVYTASKKPISAEISSVGIVEATDEEIIYSETSARVEEIIVKVGDQVKAGDTLLRFKNDLKTSLERNLARLKLQLSSANLALSDLTSPGSQEDILQAEATLAQGEKSESNIKNDIATQELGIKQANRELETATKFKNNNKELLDSGIIAQKEYDDIVDMVKVIEDKIKIAEIHLAGTNESMKSAIAEKTKAQHAVDLAYNRVTDKKTKQLISVKQNDIQSIYIQINELQDEIAKTNLEVKSTMDGIVSEIMVNQGSLVEAGKPMITILNVSNLKVIAQVSTFSAPQVALGQEATIIQNSLEKTKYTGKVTEIAPSAIEKKSGATSRDIVPITITLSDDTTWLKPGFSVDVQIQVISKSDALTLPILSIMEDTNEDYQYVFLVNDDNTLEKRKIQELTLNNTDVEVTGVEIGERVVSDPTQNLTEGTLVTILESDDDK